MPFNILSSIQSEANVFSVIPTYDTFSKFTNTSSLTTLTGCTQAILGGQTCCMSEDGQYILYTTNAGNVVKSSNYGATYSYQTISTGNYPQSVCMNGTGQYQYAISNDPTAGANNFWYSTNYGATWTGKNVPIITNGMRNISCGYTRGECIILMCGNGSNGFKYSVDNGLNFTQFSARFSTFAGEVSDDGSVVYICGNASGGNPVLSKSVNILTNPTTINPSATFTDLFSSPTSFGALDVIASSDQKYILIITNVTLFYFSSNSGASFSSVSLTAVNGKGCAGMSRDGKYIIYSCQSQTIKYTNNYGTTWNTATTTGNFLAPNQPSAMTLSWLGNAVSKTGDKAFIITSNNVGTEKSWLGTNTVV